MAARYTYTKQPVKYNCLPKPPASYYTIRYLDYNNNIGVRVIQTQNKVSRANFNPQGSTHTHE